MKVFPVFIDKYFRPCGCCETKFTTTVKCTNMKTKIQSEIIGKEIIGMQI